MIVSSIEIKNFRLIKHQVINLERYTTFIGPNGSGKSTILCALNLFFQNLQAGSFDSKGYTVDDYWMQNTNDPIEITVTFTDLPQDALESELKSYIRQGQLIITSRVCWNAEIGRGECKQYGQRLVLESFVGFFDAVKRRASVTELNEIYSCLQEQYPDLPTARSKDDKIAALRAYEESMPEQCTLIPSDDQFYGFTKGTNLLEKYVQWIYVPAVKDAREEDADQKNSFLSKLVERRLKYDVDFTERIQNLKSSISTQINELIEDEKGALALLSNNLSAKIQEWATPDAKLTVQWTHDQDKIKIDQPFAQITAQDSIFSGNIFRFGHGFQRSFLFALLQEIASLENESGNMPRLILGCEEPELYQHPPQAIHLSEVLHNLTQVNNQVLLTTHSPYFVRPESITTIRLTKKNRTECKVYSCNIEKINDLYALVERKASNRSNGQLAKIHKSLQPHISEMFFASFVIFVESDEDAAYILTYMELMGLKQEFLRNGCHIVKTFNKSNMIKPLILAKDLDINVFVVFDGDSQQSKPENTARHEKDNNSILKLLNSTTNVPFVSQPLITEKFAHWPNNIGETVTAELGDITAIQTLVFQEFDQIGDLKKCPLYISSLLKMAWEKEKVSESLMQVCRAIIASSSVTQVSPETLVSV